MSPDLILTLNRHVWPVPWAVDWITGPCLKALPTDGFSPLIRENFQNTRQDINIKHVTLEIIENWHQSNESGSQLINSVNRKFQIENNSYKWFYVTFEVSDTLPLHEVIGSELRGPLKKKKKKSNKTGCNQNMPALSLFRWSVELTDVTFFSSYSIQRIRVFLFANQPNFTQVSIITLQYIFTYLLTDVHLLKTALSWAAKIFKCFKLPNPFLILFVLLETTLTTIL